MGLEKVERLKTSDKVSTPFMVLNDLFKEHILVQDQENLEYLVCLLNSIIKKAVGNRESITFKFQMNKQRVKSLCSTLLLSSESVMKKLSYVISVFCYEKDNLEIFLEELKMIIFTLSQQLNAILERNLVFLNSQKHLFIQNNIQSLDI